MTFILLILFPPPDPKWNLRNEAYLEKTVPAKIKGAEFLVSSYALSYLQGSKWAYSFLSRETLSPEQAHELLQRIHSSLVEEMGKNREAIQYLYQTLDPPSLNGEDISLKISFWTKDYDRVQPPSIAQMIYLNGKIYYYYSDAEGHLLEQMAFASS